MNHWSITVSLVQVDLSVEFVEYTWMRGDFSVSPLMTLSGNVGFRLQMRGEGKTKVIPEDPVSFHSCT